MKPYRKMNEEYSTSVLNHISPYIHSHVTHEEKQKCWVSFGECWKNPRKSEKTKQLINNKPGGTGARDGFNSSVGKD